MVFPCLLNPLVWHSPCHVARCQALIPWDQFGHQSAYTSLWPEVLIRDLKKSEKWMSGNNISKLVVLCIQFTEIILLRMCVFILSFTVFTISFHL